jgi:hypothetical protein
VARNLRKPCFLLRRKVHFHGSSLPPIISSQPNAINVAHALSEMGYSG